MHANNLCISSFTENHSIKKRIKQVHYVTNWINRISGHRAEPHKTADVQMGLSHVMFDATMVLHKNHIFSLTCDNWEYVWCHNVPHAIQTPEQVSFITLQRAGPPLSIKTTFFTQLSRSISKFVYLISCLMTQLSPLQTHECLQVLFSTLQRPPLN